MYFDITGEVKQYTYRTANVRNPFLSVPRENLRKFEEKLAAAAGTRPDNHTVYRITHEGSTVYVKFSDFDVIFAWSVVEGIW